PIIGLLILAGVVYGGWVVYKRTTPAEGEGPGGGGGGRRGAGGPSTVTAVEAKEMDFEEWTTVSGTVTPLNVVTVRSRVDGQLMQLHFSEGAMVKEGDLLAEIDPRPFQVQLDQAVGQKSRNEALLENALADQDRYQKLLKQDSIARQQVDAQASLVSQYKAAIVSDTATVAAAQLQLDYTKITAPLSGRAGLRQVDPGNLIRSSDASGLVSITQMDPMGMVFSVPQTLVPLLVGHLTDGTEVPVEALGQDLRAVLAKGKLLTSDNEIDTASGTLRLKAEFPNADSRLFPNQFVNVRIRVRVMPKSVTVPATAVQESSRGRFVYVVQSDNTVVFTSVESGATYRELTRIAKGLKPGDKVVTSGLDRLRDGSTVVVVSPQPESGGSGPGGKKDDPATAAADATGSQRTPGNPSPPGMAGTPGSTGATDGQKRHRKDS
ncbi:MAG: MdtA/MuxA family multidrug efflux RND transporter periplasmic adaptor subunit, partial [Verrucomicrobiaceae bacterium]